MTEPTQDEPGSGDQPTGEENGRPGDNEQVETEDDDELLGALAGLRRPAAASPDFGDILEDKIRERSGGRFFGRPSLQDRVWITVLALIILVLGVGLFLLIRESDTGSLRLEEREGAPEIAPGAKDALPKP